MRRSFRGACVGGLVTAAAVVKFTRNELQRDKRVAIRNGVAWG